MWFYFALATSLLSAISVILNKRILKDISPSVLTWCTLVLATPIIAIFAYKEGVPRFSFFFIVGIIGSVLFYTISKILQYRAFKLSDLSVIYPLVSLGPIFTLLIAYLPPLNEKPKIIAVMGVIITLLGTYILNVSSVKDGLLKPLKFLFENKASVLMVLAVIIDGFVLVFDKIAINNTEPKNTTFVLLIENILVIIGFIPVFLIRKKTLRVEIWNNKKLFIILGLLNAVSTTMAFSAVGSGNVGIVATILKAQLLFVLLFSFIFFKDRPKLETVIGSLIMILGVVLIKIGL